MTITPQELDQKIEQLSTDIGLTHKFVHGTKDETVPLGEPAAGAQPAPTPTVRGLVESVKVATLAAIGDTAAEVQQQIRLAGSTQVTRVQDEATYQIGLATAAVEKAEATVNDGLAQIEALVSDNLEMLASDSRKQKELISVAGNSVLLEINNANNNALTGISATGNIHMDRLRNTGAAELSAITSLAGEQQARLNSLGAAYVADASHYAGTAKTEAERAEAAAALAEDVAQLGPASAENYGFVRIGEGLSVTADGTISVSAPALVSTPVLDFPPIVGIGYSYTLSMSAESFMNHAAIKHFMVTLAGPEPVEPIIVVAQNNTATLEITPTGNPGSVGSLTVIAVDTADNSSRPQTITFTQNTVVLRPPSIIEPANGAENIQLTPVVSVQGFAISGVSATPVNTQIQVAADDAFSSILDDSGDATYSTAYTVNTPLPVSSQVYARARHKAEKYGWSDWGAVTRFTTMSAAVNAPIILAPAASEINVVLRPTIQVSAFGNSGPADTPKGTQIQVSDSADFSSIVAEYAGAYSTTFTPAANLLLTTAYYVRARHEGHLWGWSPWGAVLAFATQGASLTLPVILSPTLDQTGVGFNPTISISAPLATNQAWEAAQCRIKQGENIIYDSGEIPASTAFTTSGINGINTLYGVEVRVKGSVSGWTAWVTSQFTIINVTLGVPGIISPTAGATGVGLNPQIKLSASPVLNQSVTQVECRVKQGESIVWSSGQVAWATAFTPAGIATLDTLYVVEARAYGSITGWGDWATSRFTTLAASLGIPAITSPASGATGVQPNATITWTAPPVVGQEIEDYYLEIATDSGFSTASLMFADWVGNATSYAIPSALFGTNTQYYLRVKAKGSITGESMYSDVVAFTTIAAPAVQNYTTPGTYEYTVPVSGEYLLMAAGAGGGCWGDWDDTDWHGGSSGAAAYTLVILNAGTVMSIVVGNRSVNSVDYYEYSYPGPGGTSSIGTHVTATGGGNHVGGTWVGTSGINGQPGKKGNDYSYEKNPVGGAAVNASYAGHTVYSGAGGYLNRPGQMSGNPYSDDGFKAGNGSAKIAYIGQ